MLLKKLSIFFTVSLCLLGLLHAQPVPELLYYDFEGSGTSVPNLASSPPSGTATATIVGGLTQGDTTGACGSAALIGTGTSSTTNYLNTGWAPNLGSSSWTISFRTENISGTSSLFYIFGDANTGGWRCFTNGVAGPGNWILRGPISDISIPGGATVAPHVCTFVYNSDSAKTKAYLDGVLVSTVAQSPPNVTGSGPFKVGGYSSNVGLPAGGTLDNFRLYNRALSDAEVLSLSNCALPAAPEIALPNGNDSITVCSGTPLTLSCPTANVQEYLWYKNGTAVNYQNGGSGTYTVNTVGTGTDVYELEVVYVGTSSVSAKSPSVTVVKTEATATIVPNGPTTFCVNTPTTLNATSGMTNYVWKRSTTIVQVGGASYTPTNSGNYTVIVTNSDGCQKTAAITPITVRTLPTANAGADKSLCKGASVQIGAGSVAGNTYTWSPTTGLNNPYISNPTLTTNATGTYTVSVSNGATGCNKSDAMVVTSISGPATPSVSKTVSGTTITLTSATPGATSVNWYSNGVLLFSNMAPNSSINVVASNPVKAYTVKSKGTNGCLSDFSNFVSAKVGDDKTGDVLVAIDENIMQAYPNPTNGLLNVVINDAALTSGTLLVYNSLGQVVATKEISFFAGKANTTLDLQHLTAGIYSLSFENKVIKVVKE